MKSSVNEIRKRLLFLLLRAFVLVLFLSFLFFTVIIGYFLTSSSTPLPFPFVSTLEGYYLARGSWDNVESVFDSMDQLGSMSTLLLDKEHRLILDRRPDPASIIGTSYEIQKRDVVFTLEVRSEKVGYLVITPYSVAQRFGFARAIILPVGIISFILTLFLIIVSILLIRRFVNPLADVIFAARAVADGKFNTRISSEGPQDLRSLSESFNEMASSLERSDRQRRDMLADVAHELRNPLSVIRGRLEGIVDGVYTADEGQVALALEQTYLLERLVDDLRLLTLAETRQLQFEKKSVELDLLAQHTLEIFSAGAREKNIALFIKTVSGNVKVEVDPQRMEQVIGNLIGNSLRYIPAGGKIWLTLKESSEDVELCINDNGDGVPNEDLPFLFDRFWRKDKSRSRNTGGTGLGLAIAKQLIEAQGGKISAQNLEEGGLQIQILLKKG